MTKITGRPPKAIKQEKFIGYFVTNAQHAIIQEKAVQAKVNISDYMRQMAVNGYVKIRWTEEDVALLKQLVAFSNDLNELVDIAEREGVLSAMLLFGKYRDRIDKLIKHLQHDRKGV
jgi:hypothetical protein